MKYLILGAGGQLGKEFNSKFEELDYEFMAFTSLELNIFDFNKMEKIIAHYKPDIVLNCAAYNKVDLGELVTKLGLEVNYLAVENLAKLSKKYRFKFIHFSTDYVFDGSKELPYNENDPTNPLNEYGKSKLLGEVAIQKANIDYLIFRLSWVYGEGKQNFIYKFIDWAKHQNELKIVEDEFSVPTYTKTIVNFVLLSLQKNLNGIYHLASSGYTSRFDYAKKIIEYFNLKNTLIPIKYLELGIKTKRPLFSVMSSDKLSLQLGIKIPHWEDDLLDFINNYYLLK